MVALITATVIWILGAIQQIPCRITTAGQYPNSYAHLCYSDIPLLYRDRGLVSGHIPYLDHGSYPTLEYPVLTGWLVELQRRIAVLFGAPTGTGLGEQQQIDAAAVFTAVNLVVLGSLFLLTVWAYTRIATLHAEASPAAAQQRRWDAMLLAVSPSVALAGFINWDLLPVALTALGCLFWARRRPGLAGVMLGLGMAAKLYPVLLLGPLLLLCLRARRVRQFISLMVGFAVAWLLPNLPVLIIAPDQWRAFWTFNSDRGADLGSIWYVLSLAGHPVSHLNAVTTTLLLLCCAAVGCVIIFARRRPRFGQVAYLVVLAFLITSKVYSPQYVLWLLPLLILARPRWREWCVFTVGELIYFLAIWGHLDGSLAPDQLYWFAVVIRICCELWVAIMIIRDIYDPDRHDPIRGVVRSGSRWTAPRTTGESATEVQTSGHGAQASPPVGASETVGVSSGGGGRTGQASTDAPATGAQGSRDDDQIDYASPSVGASGPGGMASGVGDRTYRGSPSTGVSGSGTKASADVDQTDQLSPSVGASGPGSMVSGESDRTGGPASPSTGASGGGAESSGRAGKTGPASSAPDRDFQSGSGDRQRRAVIYGPVADDPTGGVLDGAPDAAWVARLRSWIMSEPRA